MNSAKWLTIASIIMLIAVTILVLVQVVECKTLHVF